MNENNKETFIEDDFDYITLNYEEDTLDLTNLSNAISKEESSLSNAIKKEESNNEQ